MSALNIAQAAARAALAATATTATPIPPQFDCSSVDRLPMKGLETLLLSSFFLLFIVCFNVSFIDVCVKQLFTSFIDPVVVARLAEIQRMFPNLGMARRAEEDAEARAALAGAEAEAEQAGVVPVKEHTLTAEDGTIIRYDRVCAAEAYIAGKSVDDDMLFILANNECFGTVSSYCSSTVRGYAMLSAMLVSSSMCMGFMWSHNVIIDRSAGDWVGYIGLLGYVMAGLTGVVMCGPSDNSVHRNANLALFTNIPLEDPYRKMLSLHGIGIGGFVLLPLISHWLTALTLGKDKMPNYAVTMAACSFQFSAAIMFGLSTYLPKHCPSFSKLLGRKLSIFTEIILVFGSYIAFVQYEFYAAAACANRVAEFHTILLVCMFAPFAMCARHTCWAPTSYATPPSLMLMYQGAPVATYGPCPVAAYNGATIALPRIPHAAVVAPPTA